MAGFNAKSGDDKSIWFWVHVDESEKAVCDPYLLDVKEKPVTKESLEQPCPKCAKPLKRMQKTVNPVYPPTDYYKSTP